MKKAAIMIYPMFCMQEISCLTELFLFANKKISVFAASLDPVMSEDGFTILPEMTFDEFKREDHDCVVLPGIWDPEAVADNEKNIAFLRQFCEDDILIAAISSSPMLLAKAGLLKHKHFYHGLFEECFDDYEYLHAVANNVVRKPVVEDQNMITAVGFAFREFAVAVLQKLSIPCPDHVFSGVTKKYTKAELTHYRLSEEEMFSDMRESKS